LPSDEEENGYENGYDIGYDNGYGNDYGDSHDYGYGYGSRDTLAPRNPITPPTNGGGVIMSEDGRWLAIDSQGVPLGEWIWDEYHEVWVFEEFTQQNGLLGVIPQTGLPDNTMNWLLLAFAMFMMFAIATRRFEAQDLQ